MKLTDDIRREISAAVLKHKFEPLVQALVPEIAKAATTLYNATYTATERAKMDALPNGWLGTTDCTDSFKPDENHSWIRMRFNGETTGIEIMNKYARNIATVRKRVQYVKATIPVNGVPDAIKKAVALDDEYKALSSRLWNTLKSVTTVKKLLEQWPDIEPFIPAGAEKPANLPAIPAAELNKVFGLTGDANV